MEEGVLGVAECMLDPCLEVVFGAGSVARPVSGLFELDGIKTQHGKTIFNKKEESGQRGVQVINNEDIATIDVLRRPSEI